MRYMAKYVHKISPSDKDVRGPVDVPDSALVNGKTLGAALRNAGVLFSGETVKHFRGEGDKIVVFPGPRRCIWHSITLTPVV